MISIIISSVNPVQLTNVVKNIKDTIAVDHEIISFNNGDGSKGICEIYNMGIDKAQYNILCFMHEDVEIKSSNWGQLVIDKFNQNTELGLLGIAGTCYKTLTPAGWEGAGYGTSRMNYIQSFKFTQKAPIHYYVNPHNDQLSEVAVVDGVWFCTTKKVVAEFRFDAITFKRFHGYDTDFSLTVGQKYKVAVTYDILLNHFSEGNYNNEWMNDNLKLHEKWAGALPVKIGDITVKKALRIEKSSFKNFIDQLIRLKYSKKIPLSILSENKNFFSADLSVFTKLYFYVFLKYLKAKK